MAQGTVPLRIRIAANDRLDRDSDLLIDQLPAIDNSNRLIDGPLTKLDAETLRAPQRPVPLSQTSAAGVVSPSGGAGSRSLPKSVGRNLCRVRSLRIYSRIAT